MSYILFYFVSNLLPDAATLARLIQIHAAILSFAVFAYVLYHSRPDRRSKSSADPRHFIIW